MVRDSCNDCCIQAALYWKRITKIIVPSIAFCRVLARRPEAEDLKTTGNPLHLDARSEMFWQKRMPLKSHCLGQYPQHVTPPHNFMSDL